MQYDTLTRIVAHGNTYSCILKVVLPITVTLHDRHDVPNHRQLHCLFNRLFRRISKKTSKLRTAGLCEGNQPGAVDSPHKGPVTRKAFPGHDVSCICTSFMPPSYGCGDTDPFLRLYYRWIIIDSDSA